MKISAASAVLPLMLTMLSAHTQAGVVTFDFYELIKNQSSNISGRLSDGSDYYGPPLATAYESLSWNQGVTLTARTEFEMLDEFNYPTYEYEPGFVFLQPGFAGIATCEVADCTAGHKFYYTDKLILDFSEVVEIINIEFGNGKDETWWPSPAEWEAEHGLPFDLDEDFRAYSTRLNATGSDIGFNSGYGGFGDGWDGLLVGNRLEFNRNEGTGFYLESITLRTVDAPEPPMLALMLLGLLSIFVLRFASRWQNEK